MNDINNNESSNALTRETLVDVENRCNGSISYHLPEQHIDRFFSPGEVKRNISYGELMDLSMQPGGQQLIYNYLYIKKPEVIEDIINGKPEPEYWLTEDKIPNWIKTCSLAEFKDALDFAPAGVKDLIKKIAVDLPLNDNEKRDAMKEVINFDVTAAIKHKKEAEEGEDKDNKGTNGRRATVNTANLPSYTFVDKK